MAAAKFLRYIEFERRYSKHTIAAYRSDIDQFLIYLNDQFQINDFTAVNHFHIRSWIVSLIEAKLNARSVNRKITVLKSLYKFLLREELITKNPMLKIQSPKVAKRLPVFVEKSKMNLLIDTNEEEETFETLRDHLIVELFYFTGVRVSELTGLKVKDVNLPNQTIKVLGKRNKERMIPYVNALNSSLDKFISIREQTLNHLSEKNEFLFISKSGKQLNRFWVYNLITKKLGSVTTLQKRSPHVLRHTFATHMLDNGADINAIKELLGHSSLAATQVYTHNTIEKLKNIYKQAHPKA